MARVPASKRASPFNLSRSSEAKAKESRFMRCRSVSFRPPLVVVSVICSSFLGGVLFGFGALQLEAQAGPRGIGAEVATLLGMKHPVKEHALDPRVVVEVLKVHERLHRAAGMRGDRR